MQKVNIGIIGIGGRGHSLARLIYDMSVNKDFPYDVDITAICDIRQNKAESGAEDARQNTGTATKAYYNADALLDDPNVNAVIIATAWQDHVPIAIKAMKKGIRPAMECGGASSVEECIELVRVSRETGVPCMFLENCNYGREEMALLNMCEQGVFGELIHVQCGYQHDLRVLLADNWDAGDYRIFHHIHRNGELYPMHGLGPMMKLLKINNGNRFTSLVSMSSKARGLNEWAKENRPMGHPLQNKTILQGDVVTTLLKCQNGETLQLSHDSTLPRPYSRNGHVQGTKGIWKEDNQSIYIEGVSPHDTWENFHEFIEKHGYEHPMWDAYIKSGVKEGHGGMDYLVLCEFMKSVATMSEPPIDVYDSALLKSITPLSEKSIALGSHPVEVPDFSGGKYIAR